MHNSKPVLNTIIAAIMVFSFCASAQEKFLGHTIQFTPKDRPRRSLEQDDYKNVLLKKYDSLILNKTYLDEFVKRSLAYKIQYLNSNREYENLAEATTYLNSLVKLLEFDKILNKPIAIKIVRDPEFNAYVYEDGIIYIHIGLLANVDNEAELAAVLAHELGHIANQHTYKRFLHEKDFLKSQGRINVSTQYLSHMIATSINKKEYSNDLVGQEEEADAFAFELIKKSDYDFSAVDSLFSKFSETDAKYKNTSSYRRPWFYFKTHPNSEKRREAASKFGRGFARKSRFLVDSAQFFKIKRQALDETLNLYFEQLDFDNSLELAFKQHLFFPNDPFYLFYITESTRRLMASDEEYGNRLFISGIYKPGFCKAKPGLRPAVMCSGGKTEVSDPAKVSNSIFNKLVGPILSINAAELKSISNNRLVQGDTVLLLTYKDAYSYFTDLNRRLGYGFINYAENNSSASLATLDSIFSTTVDKRTYYRYLPALVNQYRSSRPADEKILWILYDFDYASQKNGVFTSSISTDGEDSYNQLIAYLDSSSSLNQQLARKKELNFEEYNKITYYLSNAGSKLKEYKTGVMKMRKPVNYNMQEVMPELYVLLHNHHYKAIIFSSISISVSISEVMGRRSTESSWNINNYLFDARSNTISCYAGNIQKNEYPNTINLFNVAPVKDLKLWYFDTVLETARPSGN